MNDPDGCAALQAYDLTLWWAAHHETRVFHPDYISSERYCAYEAEAEMHAHEPSSEDLMTNNFDAWDRARHHAKDYATNTTYTSIRTNRLTTKPVIAEWSFNCLVNEETSQHLS